MDNLQRLFRQEDYKALYSGAVFPVIFTFVSYLFAQDSTPLLLFVYLFTFFYITQLLSSLRMKARFYYIMPISSEQFIRTLYTIILKNIAILSVSYLIIYCLLLKFSRAGLHVDDITIYIDMCCLSIILSLLLVYLHFKIERMYTTLVQIIAFILTTLLNTIVFLTLDRIGIPLLSSIILLAITVLIVIMLYKQTIKAYFHFEMR